MEEVCGNSTVLRVVFDGSAKTTSGLSLNDVMMVGVALQDGIFVLMLRFRRHAVVLIADIEKMFRQFWVNPEDRCYQKILWRNNEDEPLKTYQLKTITYGTSSVPFLATRCLKQLAEDEGTDFPEAAEVLKNDFYMDDMVTGTDSLIKAKKLRDQMIELTSRAGLHLCKWMSNDPRAIEELPDSLSKIKLMANPGDSVKTLGISWNAKEDTFSFDVSVKSDHQQLTKRMMLSKIAQLYDPLGILAPVIVLAKIMIQRLWKSGLNWDDPVSKVEESNWNQYHSQLELLLQWSIPRTITVCSVVQRQLHGFSDASEVAYGACLYLRITEGDQHKTLLLAAKSRLSHIKSFSLPRLELCGSVLLAKLLSSVKRALKVEWNGIRLWSDSMIVLSWIQSSPHTLKTFVANRVAEIQRLTELPN